MNTTISKVLRYSKDRELFPAGSTVLVAVSGGADSMALLDILVRCSDLFGIKKITAFHLNHRVRGEEALRDEQFVEDYCKSRRIPLIVYRLSEEEVANHSEALLRDLRYRYLAKAKEKTESDLIALGHTKSDQAETVFFRLMRGSGLLGVSGMTGRAEYLVRPLLCLSREETEQYCAEKEIRFCMDSTNDDDRYSRNYIRHQILPAAKGLFPSVEEHISDFSDIAREADSYFREKADRYLSENNKNGVLSIKALHALNEHRIVLEYCLLRYLDQNGIPYDSDDIRNGIRLFLEDGTIQLKEGHALLSSKGQLFLDPDAPEICQKIDIIPSTVQFVPGRMVRFKVESLPNIKISPDESLFYSCIDYDKVNDGLILRNWRDGDRFTSLRRKCSKSLKKYFAEKGLTIPDKKRQAVVQCGDRIIWLEGEGICPEVAVNCRTDKVLIIEIMEDSVCPR